LPDAGVETTAGCTETIPKGAVRPALTEEFPSRSISGWASMLRITIRHGKGERVLPSGLDLSSASDAKTYLRKAGFAFADPRGSAEARLWVEPESDPKNAGTTAVTHLELPLVPLPEKPGRSALVVPPLPVAVARANGEIATVCTQPHVTVVDDPTANTPDAAPKPNPPPEPQREDWTALRRAVQWGALGIVVGALVAFFIYRIVTRPKPAPPPPPPRPPWEIALEQLAAVRSAGLVDAKREAEFFDRVSDAVRGYLGARFGFDGLESTTDEIVKILKSKSREILHASSQASAPQPLGRTIIDDIRSFLASADLVKFANLKPEPDQCIAALATGEHIVRSTMPRPASATSNSGTLASGTNAPSSSNDETMHDATTRDGTP